MSLSKKSIKDFKELYQKDYGIALDNGEDKIVAQNFFQLMKTVYKQIEGNNK